MDKNTQQPVAWLYHYTDSDGDLNIWTTQRRPEVVHAHELHRVSNITPLYRSAPVPRDVLMAAMRELQNFVISEFSKFKEQREKSAEFESIGGSTWDYASASTYEHAADITSTVDIAAIADRYASQVRQERVAPDVMDALVGNDGGRKPEPVNQQTLAALKRLLECYKMADHHDGYCCCGSPMATHDYPMNCGHCATDAGEYNAGLVIKDMEAAIAAAEAAQPVGAEVEQLKVAANNWPAQCPITRRDFFMEIDGVPTYGGPYDSYTIPEMTGEATQPFHERELFVRRYDHDLGGWVDDEFIPLRVIHEDVLMELEEAAQQPASAQPVAVPDGYVLVPKEPTDAMLDAAARASMQHLIDCINDPVKAKDVGSEEMTRLTHASRYRAMLSAAQKPEGGV